MNICPVCNEVLTGSAQWCAKHTPACLKDPAAWLTEFDREREERFAIRFPSPGVRPASCSLYATFRWGEHAKLKNELYPALKEAINHKSAAAPQVEISSGAQHNGRQLLRVSITGKPWLLSERPMDDEGIRKIADEAVQQLIKTCGSAGAVLHPKAYNFLLNVVSKLYPTCQNNAPQTRKKVVAYLKSLLGSETAEMRILEEQLRNQALSEISPAKPTQQNPHMLHDKKLVEAAFVLEKSGILESQTWLSARTDQERAGAVGEWLAAMHVLEPNNVKLMRPVFKESEPLSANKVLLKNVRFIGNLYNTADTGSRPTKVNTDICSELDLLSAEWTSTDSLKIIRIMNVKINPADFKEGQTQNTIALTALAANGKLFAIDQRSSGEVRQIKAQDVITGEQVDLTNSKIDVKEAKNTVMTGMKSATESGNGDKIMNFTYMQFYALADILAGLRQEKLQYLRVLSQPNAVSQSLP
jgi:hypothetical protein